MGSQQLRAKALGAVLAALLLGSALAWAADLTAGLEAFRAGKYENAVAALSELTAAKPDDLSARFWLGRSQLAAGRVADSIATFQAILAAKPGSTDTRYWLGMALLRQNRPGEARDQFASLLAQAPSYVMAREGLAQAEEALTSVVDSVFNGPLALPVRGGTRVAVDPGTLPVDIGTVDLLSSNVYDYTFSDSPADWFALSGLWNVTNRWTCSPQWSWEGGYADDGIAMLWNKREFVGDITVEAYRAFKMGLGVINSYKNPNDLNITICGDGANPASGYSFMVGADRNGDTRIMKGDKILASTTDNSALLPLFEDGYPSTYDFHRKWWSLRARKHGNQLELYLDEKLVLQATDPEPLDRGRVGMWIYDNGTMISRVKLYYQTEKTDRSPIPGMDKLRSLPQRLTDVPFSISSATHPSLQNDFERGVEGWAPRDQQDPVRMGVVPRTDGEAGHCLQVVNPVSGGTFAATISSGQFDVGQYPMMSFDYRLPADGSVKANLYLTCIGRTYEIIFTGPLEGTPRAEQIGVIEGVQADGKWHRASFDLLGCLREHVPGVNPLRAGDLWIGNLCEGPSRYLLAGFGGNFLGTSYELDNFALYKPGGAEVTLALNPSSDVKVDGWAVSATPDEGAHAPQVVTTTEASVPVKLAKPGVWFVNLRGKVGDNAWTPTRHYRVQVAGEAPQVVKVLPAPGTDLGDGPVTLTLSGDSGVDPESLKVSVNGQDLAVDGATVAYRPDSHELMVDPRPVLKDPKDGDTVAVEVSAPSDWAGNRRAESYQYSYRLSFADDKTPPQAAMVKIGPNGYLADERFENGVGEISSYGGSGGAELSVDRTTAASGRGSLRVYNPVSGGRLGVYLQKKPFDAGKYRIVSFDYKVGPRLRSDFAVYVNGDWKAIKFKDTDDNLGYIGVVPNLKDDDQWHHAEFNLYDMLRKDDPGAGSYIVRQFVMADWNWTANVKGRSYNLDNFQIVPVVSSTGGLPLAWRAPDISGIAGLGWVVDSDPATDAPAEITLPGSTAVLQGVSNVDGWLHTRLRDGAGNWGATEHWRLLADSESPTCAVQYPREGARSARSSVTLSLTDKGIAGIDPASVTLNIAGRDYTVDNPGLSYSSGSGLLTWNCEQVAPEPVVLPDKQPVAVKLVSARDYAGNPVAAPPAYSWIMDWSLDKTPPTLARLQSTTHPTFLTCTFENGTDAWRALGSNGARVEVDNAVGTGGGSSIRLTQQQEGGTMGAIACSQSFSLDNYPVVTFDYCLDPGVKLDMVVRMANGNDYAVAFTDNPSGSVGNIPGARADGRWGRATVDLAQIVRQRQQQGTMDVASISFTDRNKLDNPVGARAWFDNFIIGKIGSQPPVFRWKATDATGVSGYSWLFDRASTTQAPETNMGQVQSFRVTDRMDRGRWYLHVRACDGAGNWGTTTHYAILHLSAD